MKPWQQLLTNLANLLKVKTVVTLVIVFTFCFKTLQGIEITSEFIMISTAVITYYFTKDNNERASTNNKNRRGNNEKHQNNNENPEKEDG